jgi:Zn-dependent protease with chaperone function
MSDAVTMPPAAKLAALSRPSSAYKRSARLAVAGLLAFVALYFGLASWFLYTAWRLVVSAQHTANTPFWSYVSAVVALTFGVFMLKAIFAVRNAQPEGLLEVKADEQPRLFAYLHQLADAAGAPRPHRVFLSNRVNAAVFYDLSLLNLVFPTRKNLEIGLPLVNAMPLGELRAVLAHEFGHFAQRSMAVGRWVYVAQQIVQQVVARRDKLDAFLEGLGRVDFRLLVVAWALQLVVWSIRSLVESAFHVLVAMQRALSREMEMQADLVAVSLTGSDALIHALHRLQSADDAWERTVGFVLGERAEGRSTRDAFAIQRNITLRMSVILDDGKYGSVPPLPKEQPEAHRLFKPELGQPPRMWQTHPQNHEREANAKREYVAAQIDQSSAWSLFDSPARLKEQMTARLLEGAGEEIAPVPLEESMERLARDYGREQYHGRYCGLYFGRTLTRHAASMAQLRAERDGATAGDASALYPESLKEDVQQLRQLYAERGQLEALIAGHTSMQGSRLQFGGAEYHRRELPALKRDLDARIVGLEQRLLQQDAICRRWHHDAALKLGQGWPEYLDSLLHVLHYTEHTVSNLRDAYGLMQNTRAVVTAVRRQTSKSIDRLLNDCAMLHDVLSDIYRGNGKVVLDPELMERLEIKESWQATLGEFTLPHASRENINDWLDASGNWVRHTSNWLAALRMAVLERLLRCETLVAAHMRESTPVEPAPAPCQVPEQYAVLLQGDERKLQTSLGWWARFLRAEGWLPGAARLVIAAAIVVGVLALGLQQGETSVLVFNGLGSTINVDVDGKAYTLPAGAHVLASATMEDKHAIRAHTPDGRLIESLEGDNLDGQAVYNIAAAAPLVQWTAYYGGKHKPEEPQVLQPARWSATHADVLFTEPPQSVSSKSSQQRTVLQSFAVADPDNLLSMVSDAARRDTMLKAHARFDDLNGPYTYRWMWLAHEAGHREILAERLQRAPDSVQLRRLEQDMAKESPEVCAASRERAAARPDDGDLYYLALRCHGNGPPDVKALSEAMARWPRNYWLKNMMMLQLSEHGDLAGAASLAEQLIGRLPYPVAEMELMLARLERYTKGRATRVALVTGDTQLSWLHRAEQGLNEAGQPANSYADLNKGELLAAMYAVSDIPAMAPRMRRLVGASDGATASQVAAALDMPAGEGIDSSTVLTSAALALRQGRDAGPYFKEAQAVFGEALPRLANFLRLVKAGRYAEAEQLLDGTQIELRGVAYSAGLVLAGAQAPAHWRKGARALLFAPERPYFRS